TEHYRVVRSGECGALDRLCERCEPAARPVAGTPEGVGGARGTWFRTCAVVEAVVDRKPDVIGGCGDSRYGDGGAGSALFPGGQSNRSSARREVGVELAC